MKLADLITPAMIQLKVPLYTREAAIQAGAALLIAGGRTGPGYAEAIEANLNRFGPYFVIAPGVAMPHAPSNGIVMAAGISVLTLQTPIHFGHEHNDPVGLVLTLAAPDSKAHMAAMGSLAGRLSQPGMIARLTAATEKTTILNLLTKEN